MSRPRRVVVAGGGVTGLCAAWALRRARPELELLLLEARPQLGGNVATEHMEGFLIDAGPDSFLRTKPDAVTLCRELGLGADLIEVQERAVFVAHHGRLEPLPAGMALAAPTRLGPLLRTPLLSARGKLRAAFEPLVPDHSARVADESIDSFVRRRLGREVAERIAAPLLGGIFAGDVRQLSLRATFPQLAALEAQRGGILRGLLGAELERRGEERRAPSLAELVRWLLREAGEAPSPFHSLRGGMGSLIEALERSLEPGSIRTGAPLEAIRRSGDGWRVEARGLGALAADAIVLATPAHAAARLVPDADLAAELRAIPYASTATAFFGFDAPADAARLRGVGFVVPEGEGRILAGTWVSSKWAGRAPEGRVLLRAFLGGTRGGADVRGASDRELLDLARGELERLMGPLGEPCLERIHRFADASPQPVVGHAARLARIDERLRALPGLYLAGSAYDGVGIPDCVRQARAAAERLVAERLEARAPRSA
jgi:oxygen-dependent protoporphyrinogen oxidase